MSIIITEEIPDATNHRFAISARVASGWGFEGHVETSYDPKQTQTSNHINIALELIKHMGWRQGQWKRTLLPDDTQMFIHETLLANCFDFDHDPDAGRLKGI
jgi:hypothetical protein